MRPPQDSDCGTGKRASARRWVGEHPQAKGVLGSHCWVVARQQTIAFDIPRALTGTGTNRGAGSWPCVPACGAGLSATLPATVVCGRARATSAQKRLKTAQARQTDPQDATYSGMAMFVRNGLPRVVALRGEQLADHATRKMMGMEDAAQQQHPEASPRIGQMV